ncbi:MAG: FAD-dependent oxidoreductase [Alphaproteobacteria bacterium]
MSDEFEVVVVGSGIAGLSAALTSARLGRSTALLAGGLIGGQLVSINVIEGIPGFPDGVPGYDFCPMSQEQADAAGAKFIMAECEAIAADGAAWRLASVEGEIVAKGVIIATGTALAKLGVPGEERLFGKGVSECASCDAPLLRGKVAVVAGGGDSAMQEALTLIEHVSKVVIVERGDALTGQVSYRQRVIGNPKIEIRYKTVVTEIIGDSGVSAVRLKDLGSGAESDLEASGVFACTGLVPNTALVRELIPLDRTGRVRVDAAMRTQVKGICAAGNVREASPHRASGAMGDGADAAIAIDRYLATGEWRELG